MTRKIWALEFSSFDSTTVPHYTELVYDRISGGGILNPRLIFPGGVEENVRLIHLRGIFKINACPLEMTVSETGPGVYEGTWSTGHHSGRVCLKARNLPKPTNPFNSRGAVLVPLVSTGAPTGYVLDEGSPTGESPVTVWDPEAGWGRPVPAGG